MQGTPVQTFSEWCEKKRVFFRWMHKEDLIDIFLLLFLLFNILGRAHDMACVIFVSSFHDKIRKLSHGRVNSNCAGVGSTKCRMRFSCD